MFQGVVLSKLMLDFIVIIIDFPPLQTHLEGIEKTLFALMSSKEVLDYVCMRL